MGLNWSKGLQTLGDNLGTMMKLQVGREEAEKERQYQTERDQFMAMREENLMRLQQNFQKQMSTDEFGQRKELITMEDKAAMARMTADQTFTSTSREDQQAHDKEMLGARARLEERLLNMRNDPTKNPDAYAKEINSIFVKENKRISDRMATVQDNLIKEQNALRAKAQEMGEDPRTVDISTLKPWQDELARLREEQTYIVKQRDHQLARLNIGGYGPVDQSEVDAILGPGSAPAAQGPRDNSRIQGFIDGVRARGAARTSPTAPQQPPVSRAAQRKVVETAPVPTRGVAIPEKTAGGATRGPIGRALTSADQAVGAVQQGISRRLIDVGEEANRVGTPSRARGGVPLTTMSLTDLRDRLKRASGTEAARIRAEIERRERRR